MTHFCLVDYSPQSLSYQSHGGISPPTEAAHAVELAIGHISSSHNYSKGTCMHTCNQAIGKLNSLGDVLTAMEHKH
jgi:hypothetical protein